MLPSNLKPEHFAGYPAEARKIVIEYLGTLQRLPLSFVPLLLRELIDFDFKFPAERRAYERELLYLSSLSPVQLKGCFQAFEQIRVSKQLEDFDWAKMPVQFVERLSAHLWSTHQLDAFRQASNDYADGLRSAGPPETPPPIPRLGISVIGQGVSAYNGPLFRKLRAHGAYYTRINPENGLRQLLNAVAIRARAHPVRYGHWYIEGGEAADCNPALTCVSYKALEPVRVALLRKMQEEIDRPGMGPEALRTIMAQIRPSELGLDRISGSLHDDILQRFEVSVLTEGSGTQIFSTVFAQWAAREALRRAQPLTLLVRFAPRQRQRSMNELISADTKIPIELDVVGSLIDGDFAAYYNWLNQQRLSGADRSCFLVWFEGHNEALAIGPSTPRGTESSSVADLQQLLATL
jgi:hypothetical protein